MIDIVYSSLSNTIVLQVYFNCSTVVQLTNITEPKTCHYEMFFHTPLACFKGAMQIFQLLPSKVMKKWETLEHEYYGGEWTLQVSVCVCVCVRV